MAPIIVGGLLQGSVFAMVALGFALVYRVTGVINLSQGAFCIVGALTMYTLALTLHWPMPLAALGAVLATTAFGAALGAATFVPALSRLPNSSMLMLTAGLLTLIEGVVLVVWGSDPYDLPAFSEKARKFAQFFARPGEPPMGEIYVQPVKVVPDAWRVGPSGEGSAGASSVPHAEPLDGVQSMTVI